MDAKLYETLKKQLLKGCTTEQLLDLRRNTETALGERSSEAAIAARSLEVTACPHCGSKENLVRHGRDAAGRQRFHCRKKDGGADLQRAPASCRFGASRWIELVWREVSSR